MEQNEYFKSKSRVCVEQQQLKVIEVQRGRGFNRSTLQEVREGKLSRAAALKLNAYFSVRLRECWRTKSDNRLHSSCRNGMKIYLLEKGERKKLYKKSFAIRENEDLCRQKHCSVFFAGSPRGADLLRIMAQVSMNQTFSSYRSHFACVRSDSGKAEQ